MEFGLFLLSFLGVYLVGGRKVAVPYGIAFSNSVLLVILITLALDLLQVPFYYFIFSSISEKIPLIRRFRINQEMRIKKFKVWKLALKYGKIGVLVVALLPSFGGGVWTAVLLSFILKLDKKISFLLIFLGSLVGITILALCTQGIISLIA